MELGKHVEGTKSGKCSDMISSLPDELLGHILSFLPTTCAVTTCILSKRWRCLFTLTNCLSFDDAPYFDAPIKTMEEGAARKKRFTKFVDKVLELQVSPIEKFSLVFRRAYGLDLNVWVSIAVRKGVQDLYCLVGEQSHVLRDFKCQTLVRLTMIGHNYELKIPMSAWLPSLRVLHLEFVLFFDDGSVERLFSSCKMLEELTLDWCNCDSRCQIKISTRLLKILTILNCCFPDGFFEIDAPNLAFLSYKDSTGLKIIPSWKDSYSLAKGELSFCYDPDEENYFDPIKYDCVLLKAFADKVTELHVMSNTLELVLKQLGPNEMPDFRSLTRFHLCDCPFNAWEAVTSLLEKSPQLETVAFHQCFSRQSRNGDPAVTPPNEELTPFSCHAKVIEVHDFYGGKYSLVYLGHLLGNARLLKRLIFHTGDITNIWQIKNAMDMLQLLPRASKDCSIELSDR